MWYGLERMRADMEGRPRWRRTVEEGGRLAIVRWSFVCGFGVLLFLIVNLVVLGVGAAKTR